MQLPSFVHAETIWPRTDIFAGYMIEAANAADFSINMNLKQGRDGIEIDSTWLYALIEEKYAVDMNAVTEEHIDISVAGKEFVDRVGVVQQAYLDVYAEEITRTLRRRGRPEDAGPYGNNLLMGIERKRIANGLTSFKDIFLHLAGLTELSVTEVEF